MRETLGLESGWAGVANTWTNALMILRERIEVFSSSSSVPLSIKQSVRNFLSSSAAAAPMLSLVLNLNLSVI